MRPSYELRSLFTSRASFLWNLFISVSPKPTTKLVDQPEGTKKQQADEIFHDETSKISKMWVVKSNQIEGKRPKWRDNWRRSQIQRVISRNRSSPSPHQRSQIVRNGIRGTKGRWSDCRLRSTWSFGYLFDSHMDDFLCIDDRVCISWVIEYRIGNPTDLLNNICHLLIRTRFRHIGSIPRIAF